MNPIQQRVGRAAFALFVAFVSAACASEPPAMFKMSPDHAGYTDAELRPPLKVKWFVANGPGFAASPIVEGGVVYAGSDDKFMYAFDAATGKEKWKYQAGAEVETTPTVAGDTVYVGAYDGVMYALDKASGALRWKYQTGPSELARKSYMKVEAGIESAPVVLEGVVYFGALDGKVYALKAKDGAVVWTYQCEGTVHGSGPAVVGGKLYIGSTGGVFYCLNLADGTLAWSRKLAEPNIDHLMSPPTVHQGVVYTGADWAGNVFALDAKDGAVKWNVKVNSLVAGSPTVAWGRLYVMTARQCTVYALDLADGKTIWSAGLGEKSMGGASPIATGNGVVWVTLKSGLHEGKAVSVAALDAHEGKVLWTFDQGGAWNGPTIDGGVLYFGSGLAPQGGVFALEEDRPGAQ